MARQFLTLVGIALLSSGIAAQVPAAALKIVVLDGENAVNIIQQKTAVRAVVEVRDRNNLPLPGASVTFGVTGNGGATVAGSQTVTVTTNAAGRASLTGMTPSSSGGLQISVNASFQGLTAPAVTITQTVVATAAAAAAVGAAAATAGAAAGGGGISTAAIVGIVAGVGAIGGGAAALGGGPGDDHASSNTFTAPSTATTPAPSTGPVPLPPCVFDVSPALLTVPISGGTFVVTVTMTPSNCASPNWPVTNVPSIVSVDRMSGTGSGTVTVTVAPFTPTETFPTRTSAIGIAGTTVNIHQPRAISGMP